MIVLLVLVGLVIVFVARRRGRKKKRGLSTDALTDALGLVQPYKGKRWTVGDRWL